MSKRTLGILICLIIVLVFGIFGYFTYVSNSPKADGIVSYRQYYGSGGSSGTTGSTSQGPGSMISPSPTTGPCHSSKFKDAKASQKLVYFCIYTKYPGVTVDGEMVFDDKNFRAIARGTGISDSEGYARYQVEWDNKGGKPRYRYRAYKDGCFPADDGSKYWKAIGAKDVYDDKGIQIDQPGVNEIKIIEATFEVSNCNSS